MSSTSSTSTTGSSNTNDPTSSSSSISSTSNPSSSHTSTSRTIPHIGSSTSTPTPTPTQPSKVNNPNSDHDTHSGGSAVGYTVFAVLIIFILAVLGYVGWKFWNARRRGLPPPQMNPFSDSNRIPGSSSRGGIVGWVQDKYANLSRQRRAGGAYEGTSLGPAGLGGAGSRRSRRPGGALDPDEAWDARVGTEADVYGPGPGGEYYEEQELSGLRGRFNDGHDDSSFPRGSFGRTGGARSSLDDIDIGGSEGRRQSELDERYDEEMGRRPRPGAPGDNPFGETAEPSNISLRDVSPRPAVEGRLPAGQGSADSPTERRSMFKENV